MYNKPIIVFEGIEGSGKSHHIRKIANYLKKKKAKFVKIREPGGSINSEKIRRLILNNKFFDFLFLIEVWQHHLFQLFASGSIHLHAKMKSRITTFCLSSLFLLFCGSTCRLEPWFSCDLILLPWHAIPIIIHNYQHPFISYILNLLLRNTISIRWTMTSWLHK